VEKSYIYESNNSETLLIIFAGYAGEIAMPVFEFFNVLKKHPTDKLFIRDLNRKWYLNGIDTTLDSVAEITNFINQKKKSYKNIVTLGTSMGGFAAILFGTLVKADVILAFSPQTFVDRFFRYWYSDFRWEKDIKPARSNCLKSEKFFNMYRLIKKSNLKNTVNIYYSNNEKLDSIHANFLKKLNTVNLHSYNFGDHLLIKEMRDNGDLDKILGKYLK